MNCVECHKDLSNDIEIIWNEDDEPWCIDCATIVSLWLEDDNN